MKMEATFWLNKVWRAVPCAPTILARVVSLLAVAILCAMVSLSASAQTISALPYTNQVNDIDRLALVSITSGTNGTTKQTAFSNLVASVAAAVGGPTNGISSATATNIVNANAIEKNSGTGTNTWIGTKLRLQGGLTNSLTVWTNGSFWFQSAQWDTSQNPLGGGLNWVGQGGNIPFDSGTPMASLRVWDNWGGSASSAVSPWMLITAPNIRLEQGYGAGYGELCLGNEDAAGSIYLNWNRGPTLSEFDTANYKGNSFPLSFESDVTDANTNHAKAFPGIIGYAPNYNAPTDSQGLRMGELWFQSLTAYRVNGGWAHNGANSFRSNTVARMRTNFWTFDGALGIDGTSKTHIDGGSITNTDILSKIVGTDSNGKLKGATLSGLTWDGTTLTASVGADLWRTNAVDGTSTNVQGGVSVGANYVGVTNAAHGTFFNLLKTGWRWMIGGSGSTIAGNTNSLAGTNGSGFFVLDSSGKLSVSGSTTFNSGEFGTFGLQSYAVNNGWISDNGYYDGSNFKARAAGFTTFLYFLGGTGFEWYGTATSASAGATVTPLCRFKILPDGSWGLGGSIIHNNALTTGAMLKQDTSGNLINWGSTTSSNGFSSRSNVFVLMPTNAAASGDILQATGLESSTAHTKWIGGVTTELTNVFFTNTWAAVNNRIVTNYFALTTPRTGMYSISFTYGTPTEGGGTTIDSSSYTTVFWTDPINGTVQSSDSFDSRTPAAGFNKWEYDKSYRVWAKTGTLLVVSNWMQDSFDGGPDTKSTNFVGAFIWARP